VKVLVCGGRNFNDYTRLFVALRVAEQFHGKITEIIHGGASGADTLAGQYAALWGIPCTVFPADWKTHGRAAGPIRNALMLEQGAPDRVVAMPGGRGTQDMVKKAKAAGIPVDTEVMA